MQPNGVQIEKSEKGYVPPKGWEKLNDSEKIERIREIIKQSQYQLRKIYTLESKILRLRKLLSNHSHNEQGVVQKIEEYDNYGLEKDCDIGSSLNPKSEDVYF